LRDGATVETLDCAAGEVSEDRVIRAMVGREMADRYPRRQPHAQRAAADAALNEPALELCDWWVQHPLHPDRAVIKGVNSWPGAARSSALPG